MNKECEEPGKKTVANQVMLIYSAVPVAFSCVLGIYSAK